MKHEAACLVTGVAGFIGSHLAERLLGDGYQVVGLDCFTDHYPRAMKERNLDNLIDREGFVLVGANLLDIDLAALLSGRLVSFPGGEMQVEGISYVFHLAAQAGVRASWGASFDSYVANNVLATQRLLEACKDLSLTRFVYASSSSVYGDAEQLPVSEDSPLRPVSPYGVTKLAGENLCSLYWRNYGVPVVSLRYFTVYGPRQRPDMGFHKFIRAIQEGKEITVYGDGEQTRDCTYVDDVVQANILAMKSEAVGQVFNVGGGSTVTVNQVIGLLEELLNRRTHIGYAASQEGDARHTWADISLASDVLGYHPSSKLPDGLKAQISWMLGIDSYVREAL